MHDRPSVVQGHPQHSRALPAPRPKPGAKRRHRPRRASAAAPRLTERLAAISDVLVAVRDGDFAVRARADRDDVVGLIAAVLNEVIERDETLTRELVRLSHAVGREGETEQRAELRGASGSWTAAVCAINSMVADLVWPTAEVARVLDAAARGDLSQRVELQTDGHVLRGEAHRIGVTVNRLVEQLTEIASDVTRVAREVGAEGKLGAQVEVAGEAGTWRTLKESVNMLAGNLTSQVRNIALVTTAVARGDLSKKITVDAQGEVLELKNTINTMVDQLRTFAAEVTRVAREVGTEGKLGGQADVPGVSGTWKDLTDNVNLLAWNLTSQVRNIALVTTAVANGDLSKKITVDARGEISELKQTINTMVEQLRAFAAEVTRVAREVGTEGKLGGQAQVPGVAGTWKDLTDNVNLMASEPDRPGARHREGRDGGRAAANLSQKLLVEAKGEIAALADTINDMTDTLRTFADQVTTVAREVGIEGQLGGQAKVPGAAGTWRDLVDNVNQLAGNLTTQVRAISEVATAVTKGDLTRTIDVEAQGEVLALKDTINQMIANLRDTTRREQGAGLAEDEPREVHGDDAGPAEPRVARAAPDDRADAGGVGAARRPSSSSTSGGHDGAAPAQLATPTSGASTLASTLRARRGAGRAGGAREEGDRRHRRARRLRARDVEPRRGAAAQRRRPADRLRGARARRSSSSGRSSRSARSTSRSSSS